MLEDKVYTASMIYTYDLGELVSENSVSCRIGKDDIFIQTREGQYDGMRKGNSFYFNNSSSLHWDENLKGLIGWWIQDGYEGFWKLENFR